MGQLAVSQQWDSQLELGRTAVANLVKEIANSVQIANTSMSLLAVGGSCFKKGKGKVTEPQHKRGNTSEAMLPVIGRYPDRKVALLLMEEFWNAFNSQHIGGVGGRGT